MIKCAGRDDDQDASLVQMVGWVGGVRNEFLNRGTANNRVFRPSYQFHTD